MDFEEVKILAQRLKAKKILQTHTSWVLLTGEFAYKIKKPVDFGFLDYTTKEKRRAYCYKELELNQRLSPEIYLGVVKIKPDLSLIEEKKREGEAIDYAVKMKELPQESLMTQFLKRGKVNFSQIKEIAKIIGGFHNRLIQTRETERYGEIETISFNWEENFTQTERFIGETISRKTFFLIKERIRSFIIREKEKFEKRIKAKKIKYCHGDLHSQNIFITDKIYIFDCIEFNPRFSCSDTASEIAFFLMDLDFHQRFDLADYFLDKYLAITRDYSLLALLSFYKAYRAFVRGKVESFKIEDKSIPQKERLIAKEVAKRYFYLSRRYANSFWEKPMVLVFFGPPGSGKTFLSEKLRARREGIILSSDLLRKDLLGLPPEGHFPADYEKGIYKKEITEKTYTSLLKKGKRYFKHQISLFLDATFSHFSYRAVFKKEFPKKSLFWILCFSPQRLILSRLKKERKYSDASFAIYQKMRSKFRLYFRKKRNRLLILNTALPVKKNLERIERFLSERN